jgi:hypothetical protein
MELRKQLLQTSKQLTKMLHRHLNRPITRLFLEDLLMYYFIDYNLKLFSIKDENIVKIYGLYLF